MKILVLLIVLSFNLFAQDEEESEYLRALRLSCDKQKVALGCFNYANALMRNGNEEAAEKYFALGCKQEHSPSCKKEKWDLPEGAKPAKKPEVEASTAPAEGPATETVPETTTEEAATEPAAEPATEPEAVPESLELDLDTGTTINE